MDVNIQTSYSSVKWKYHHTVSLHRSSCSGWSLYGTHTQYLPPVLRMHIATHCNEPSGCPTLAPSANPRNSAPQPNNIIFSRRIYSGEPPLLSARSLADPRFDVMAWAVLIFPPEKYGSSHRRTTAGISRSLRGITSHESLPPAREKKTGTWRLGERDLFPGRCDG